MNHSEEAYRQFHHQLHRYIKRRTGRDDAEDILQEVFLRVVRNEATLSQASKPLAWLYTVTQSVISDHFRKQGRTPTAQTKEFNLDTLTAPNAAAASDFGGCIASLLDSLPDTYSEALRLADMESGRQTQMAAALGIKLSTAKSRVQRGRKMLRQAILAHCNVEMDGQNRVIDVSPEKRCGETCC